MFIPLTLKTTKRKHNLKVQKRVLNKSGNVGGSHVADIRPRDSVSRSRSQSKNQVKRNLTAFYACQCRNKKQRRKTKI